MITVKATEWIGKILFFEIPINNNNCTTDNCCGDSNQSCEKVKAQKKNTHALTTNAKERIEPEKKKKHHSTNIKWNDCTPQTQMD